jgi:hypothetical protein
MTLAASVILDGASLTLLDVERVTWTEAELLGYLNEALRATAAVKTDLVPVEQLIDLAAGVEQEIPVDGIGLINITRNAAGRVVTEVDQQLLAEVQRFWPAGTQETTVEHFTVHPALPRKFNVYPPNDGTGQVMAVYGIEPPTLTAAADLLPVRETYQHALTQFVLSRAYDKNTKRQDLTKAAAAMQNWARAVGAKVQSQMATSPKVASQPGVA